MVAWIGALPTVLGVLPGAAVEGVCGHGGVLRLDDGEGAGVDLAVGVDVEVDGVVAGVRDLDDLDHGNVARVDGRAVVAEPVVGERGVRGDAGLGLEVVGGAGGADGGPRAVEEGEGRRLKQVD